MTEEKVLITTFASSNLATGEYDPAQKVLTLTFQRGAEYEYENVPQEVWDRLVTAVSPGKFFRDEIMGRYPYS